MFQRTVEPDFHLTFNASTASGEEFCQPKASTAILTGCNKETIYWKRRRLSSFHLPNMFISMNAFFTQYSNHTNISTITRIKFHLILTSTNKGSPFPNANSTYSSNSFFSSGLLLSYFTRNRVSSCTILIPSIGCNEQFVS